MTAKPETEPSAAQADRREFLTAAGKLAVGVPPALIVLLSTSMSSPAIAQSGGGSEKEVGMYKGPSESGRRGCWFMCGG